MSIELLKRAEEIVNASTMQNREAPGVDWVMSVIDEEGYPAASMITAAKAEGFKWIAFCTGLGWNKPNRINKTQRPQFIFLMKKALQEFPW